MIKILIVLFPFVAGITWHRKLVTTKTQVKQAWRVLEKQLDQRVRLLLANLDWFDDPQVQQRINQQCKNALLPQSVSQREQAEKILWETVATINTTPESPINKNVTKIENALENYNCAAKTLNHLLKRYPYKFLAFLFGMRLNDYFSPN